MKLKNFDKVMKNTSPDTAKEVKEQFDRIDAEQRKLEQMAMDALSEIHKHTTLCINEHEENIFISGFNAGLRCEDISEMLKGKLKWVEIRMKVAENAQEEKDGNETFNEGREDVYYEWAEWIKQVLNKIT